MPDPVSAARLDEIERHELARIDGGEQGITEVDYQSRTIPALVAEVRRLRAESATNRETGGAWRDTAAYWQAECGRLHETLAAQRQAVLDLIDAHLEASLKPPARDGFEPIEIEWTIALRAALGVTGDE